MEYAKIGRTGLQVSRICLGTNMFGADYMPDAQAISVVHAAADNGINYIDTADLYNDGRSEEVVGKAVKGRRDRFVIGTKVFSPTGPGPNDKGLSRKHLMDAVEASMRRLGTDYIDLCTVHWWDPNTPIEETLRTLDTMVKQGKVRYIGCSNFAAWHLCRALWASDKLGLERFEAIQRQYNLGQREIEAEIVPLCVDQQVSITPYQILMGGVLTGAYSRAAEPPKDSHMASRHAGGAKTRFWSDATFNMVDRLKAIASKLGHEPAHVAMAWALARPAVASIIVGHDKPEEVARNAKAVEIKLPPDLLQGIDDL